MTGPVESLEVPETLHALIAARLDGLTIEERRLLSDAAVLGKTFSRDALNALAGTDGDLEPLLGALVRKEVLGVQADPRSPEHGQYGFLQDLVRHVAYETLSKRERKTRHLAAAAYLTTTFAEEEDEVVEVIASHYLAAHEAAPDAEDAPDIRERAQTMLVRAGERAESLAASAEARRYYEQAAKLDDDPSHRARLLDRPPRWLQGPGIPVGSGVRRARRSRSTRVRARRMRPPASISGWAGSKPAPGDGRVVDTAQRALSVISEDEPDEDFALLAASLANGYWVAGDLQRASSVQSSR